MKNKHLFILVYCLLGFLVNNVNAQSYLEVDNCKDIVVYYDGDTNQEKSSQKLSYILEKELIKDVWEKIIVVNSIENIKIFHDLPIGSYRVSVVPLNTKKKNITKVYKRKMKFEKSTKERYDVFISNTVEIIGGGNCDEQFTDHQNTFISPNGIKIFPNPVSRMLNISYPEEKGYVAIFNVLQQEVKSQQLDEMRITQLDLSGLKVGIYIVCIYSNGEMIHSEKISYLSH